MRRPLTVRYEFVECIPKDLEDRTIYISIPYGTASHRCCCGCGYRVVTPLSPTGWTLSFNGESVSLRPSIGNWSFPCRSHYFITRNTVEWARPLSDEEIEDGRAFDRVARDKYYLRRNTEGPRRMDGSQRRSRVGWKWLARFFGRSS